ncbi:uncharacterized protein LOC132760431 [Ruditapes philippinarum]|uniref:uncharacterized protein LOC132760431 n=1 Tax=Ruditapes philippinarum TaxID=129788 RepID=UPI00295C101B|nr:uncharacterized protein LOC132760431 [Ruditapes philippinarum]
MADEYILKEESVLELDRVIEKFSKELEESFGHFYIKGLMKKISEPENKTIKNLRENLDGMKAKIECFQRDLLQACSLGGAHLEVPDRRTPFIRGPPIDRDSGYTSDLRLSVASNNSTQSENRLSKLDIKDDDHDRIPSDDAELFNPSRSGSNSSVSDDNQTGSDTKFYIKVFDLETSLTEFKEKNISTIKGEDDVVKKIDDDAAQSLTGPYAIKGRFEGLPPAMIANDQICQPPAVQCSMNTPCSETVPKVIKTEDDNTAPVIINDLSKRSSEEDNTKYTVNVE